MKSKFLTIALCLFALPLLCNAGLSQTTMFDIGPDLSNGGKPGQGDWQVTIVQTGAESYNISVTSATPMPVARGEEVQVSFLDQSSFSIAVNTIGSGATSPGGPWSASLENIGYEAQWLAPPGTPADYIYTGGLDGTNTFTGSEVLDDPASAVTVRVYDDGHGGPWADTSPLAPEASSLALLLPGLIPLGVILRKRRRRDTDSS
jgi:hypothetical protein